MINHNTLKNLAKKINLTNVSGYAIYINRRCVMAWMANLKRYKLKTPNGIKITYAESAHEAAKKLTDKGIMVLSVKLWPIENDMANF